MSASEWGLREVFKSSGGQSHSEMIFTPRTGVCDAGHCLKADSQQYAGIRRQLELLALVTYLESQNQLVETLN